MTFLNEHALYLKYKLLLEYGNSILKQSWKMCLMKKKGGMWEIVERKIAKLGMEVREIKEEAIKIKWEKVLRELQQQKNRIEELEREIRKMIVIFRQ